MYASPFNAARFASVDVETANNPRESICQVGLVIYDGGEVVESFKTYVDPRCKFGEHQTRVHGITSAHVAGAPTWPIVARQIARMVEGLVLTAHSNFDRQAFTAANEKHGVPPLNVSWLDTVKVLPLAWPEHFHEQPCGLERVAQVFGHRFNHHDALEDATLSGLILAKACAKFGLKPTDWLDRVQRPVRALAGT